ncbi:MAG: hypothetical protein CMN17_02845 [Roseovarius sp.]|nr:hypothetical protein [Roseovarius sp.]MBK43854.1 hypothetical protein [Roseovarius sp.]|tara:strand:- start:1025 stop:1195 length:171 start_codon:yes stop_codon:yes gene_type:complete
MIVILGAVLGAAGGGILAWRRKGKPADIALYAFVYALVFALAGLFLTLILHRAALL